MKTDRSEATACLIGHTGFVGSALRRQTAFDACFNSANITESAGASFGTVICAAAPGSMFEANRAPEQDRRKIHELIDQLSKVSAGRFVLISSIAVLNDFAGGDDESTQDFQTELAYGRHRRELESFVESHFYDSLIVRLPALFGEGLRKNFMFDLLNPVPTMMPGAKVETLADALEPTLGHLVRSLYAHDAATGLHTLDRAALNANHRRAALEDAVVALGTSATQFHNRDTTYQYYGIDRLWADIEIASDADLSHIHLVSEPLKAAAIHSHLTGRDMPETSARLHREDMRTRHANLWGKTGPYLSDGDTTLDELSAFFAGQRQPA